MAAMTRPTRLRAVPSDRLGYYGLRKRMLFWSEEHPAHPIPAWLWRAYWFFQPLRCRLNYHDWYGTAAGNCSACTCGASSWHSNRVMHVYRWRPWMRDLASTRDDAEHRARFWFHETTDVWEALRADAQRIVDETPPSETEE